MSEKGKTSCACMNIPLEFQTPEHRSEHTHTAYMSWLPKAQLIIKICPPFVVARVQTENVVILFVGSILSSSFSSDANLVGHCFCRMTFCLNNICKWAPWDQLTPDKSTPYFPFPLSDDLVKLVVWR